MFKINYKSFVCLFVLLIVRSQFFAQLTINSSLTPQQLVQTVLLGNGVTASNIVYTGDLGAIAQFGGTTNLGIGTGIVMTTGTTTGADGPQGPNNKTSAGKDNLIPGDPLLDAVSTFATHNASILEFDFVPTGDSINFRYVFGSEEYPEFICSSFNDIFGFFIDGPNPSGGSYVKQNIALIPGTTLPVSINNIHPGNGSAGCTPTYIQYYFDNTNGTSIQYDGFTTPLTASAAVICGSTYHIKLAIADAFDGLWDSGVFLEAGSFSSKSVSIKSKVSFGGNDTTVFEGCGQAALTLKRSIANINQVDSVDFTISGTATNGADYTLSSTSIAGSKIIFPLGQDSVQLKLDAIQDFLPEGVESFTLTLTVKECNKIVKKSVTIYLDDVTPLVVQTGNDTTLYCSNSSITLNAQALGGIKIGTAASYKFSWVDASKASTVIGTGSSIQVNPNVTTKYIVSVKDTCGLYDAKDSMTVIVTYTPMTLVVSDNDTLCLHDSTTLVATANLGFPAYKYRWQPINKTGGSVVVKPLTTTTYSVTATDSCGMQQTKTVTVNVLQTNASFDYYFPTNSDVEFQNSSKDASNYFWSFGDKSTSLATNPFHNYADTGKYKVTLIATNQRGCVDSVEHTIIVLPDMYFYYPNCFTPNKDGKNEVFGGQGIGVAKYKMTIFDRWGNLIFTSNNMDVGWNGNTQHAKAESENYICVFELEDVRGNAVQKVGNVILLR